MIIVWKSRGRRDVDKEEMNSLEETVTWGEVRVNYILSYRKKSPGNCILAFWSTVVKMHILFNILLEL